MSRLLSYLTAALMGVTGTSLVFRHEFHSLIPAWWSDVLLSAWLVIGAAVLFLTRNDWHVSRIR